MSMQEMIVELTRVEMTLDRILCGAPGPGVSIVEPMANSDHSATQYTIFIIKIPMETDIFS